MKRQQATAHCVSGPVDSGQPSDLLFREGKCFTCPLGPSTYRPPPSLADAGEYPWLLTGAPPTDPEP